MVRVARWTLIITIIWLLNGGARAMAEDAGPEPASSRLPVSEKAAAAVAAPVQANYQGFGVMDALAKAGVHDPENEEWNLYGQGTYIYFHKYAFPAKYTNLNGSNSSLAPDADDSFTQTFTLFFGARVWKGGALYFAPEEIAEKVLSNLKGLGGATENFELQKSGSARPTFYRSRLSLRQTFGLGGEPVKLASGQSQLGETVDSRRLVVTAGTYSVLDVFDKNNVIGDLRHSFFDEAFMTNSALDFPADARGYTEGLSFELYLDDWAVRLGRFMPPRNPNEQSIDFRFFKYYGDVFELEHDHKWADQPGAVRLLVYRNYESMGKFSDAISAFQADSADFNAANCGSNYNYGSQNANAPDLCFVRSPHVRMGVGLNMEQNLTADTGVFLRAMWSDGDTEVDAYDAADSAANVGAIIGGAPWGRPLDSIGIGAGASWASRSHAQYLALGGVDGFIGDGALNWAAEKMGEIYYRLHLWKTVALSAEYQKIISPGFNADRGPVNLFGGKFHVEF